MDNALDLIDPAEEWRGDAASDTDLLDLLLESLGKAVSELSADQGPGSPGRQSLNRATEICAGLLLRADSAKGAAEVLGPFARRHKSAAEAAQGVAQPHPLHHVGAAIVELVLVLRHGADTAGLAGVKPMLAGVLDQLVAAQTI